VITGNGNRRAKDVLLAFYAAMMNPSACRKPLSSLCFETPHSFLNHRSGPTGRRHMAAIGANNRFDTATDLPAGGTFTKRGSGVSGGHVDHRAKLGQDSDHATRSAS
jgi:hypothetical protein